MFVAAEGCAIEPIALTHYCVICSQRCLSRVSECQALASRGRSRSRTEDVRNADKTRHQRALAFGLPKAEQVQQTSMSAMPPADG